MAILEILESILASAVYGSVAKIALFCLDVCVLTEDGPIGDD